MKNAVKVNQCCHAPEKLPRFIASEGDAVIVKIEGRMHEAKIISINNDDVLIKISDGEHKTIQSESIWAINL